MLSCINKFNKKSVVLMGDSMVKYMHQHLPGLEVHFVPGAQVRELMPLIVNDTFSAHPRVVILHAGTNNMGDNASVSSCVDEFRRMCSLIGDFYPEAEIAISGVIYQKLGTYVKSEEKLKKINTNIDSLNENLQSLCSVTGMKFIDNSSISSKFICTDGVHLTLEGNQLLSQHFKFFMQSFNEVNTPGIVNDTEYPPLPKTHASGNIPIVSCPNFVNKNRIYTKQTVGESNRKKEKLNLLGQVRNSKSRTVYQYKKPLLKNNSENSYQPVMRKFPVNMPQSADTVIGNLSHNRFFPLASDTSSDEASSDDDFIEQVKIQEKIKRKRTHQKKYQKPRKQVTQERPRTVTGDTKKGNKVLQSPRCSDTIYHSNEVHQIFIDISILNVKNLPNCLIFSSRSREILVADIIDHIVLKTGVSRENLYLKSLFGNSLGLNATISSTEIENIVVYFKAKGGGRRKKGFFSHPGKECGPCYICKKNSFRYIHLCDRSYSDIFQYVKKKHPGLTDNHCICKSCEIACRKQVADTPQNSIISDCDDKICYLDQFNLCTDPQNKQDLRVIKVNEAEMTQVFSLPVDATSFNTISVTLCSSHRLKYFNDKRFNCSLCQKRFVRGMYKKRIPENMLDFAKTFIATIPGNMPDEQEICVNDLSCSGCFYALKKFISDNFSAEYVSTVSDVKIESILQQYSTSEKSYVTPGLAKCIVFCCNSFLMHRPVLLNVAYKEFINYTEPSEMETYSQRWLLLKLIEIFGSTINVCTDSNRKLGTMIKRSDNQDNKVLHQMVFEESLETNRTKCNIVNDVAATESINNLHACAKDIRNKFMEQKSKILSLGNIDLQSFEPFEFIKELCDPLIWEFFMSIFGEKVSFANNKINLELYSRSNVLPCFTIISSLMYALDRTCQLPLPTLFADLIDKYTNSSSDCIQIFNQFGICCSKDSLNRYQTSVIETQLESGTQISPNSFTICSIDNINKRSSYASVKAKDSSRGFDGTSVQLVEPKPTALKWHDSEKSVFLQTSCNFKDNNGTHYQTITESLNFSLYRCLACLLIYNFRHGSRSTDGLLICPLKCEEEHTLINSLESSVEKLISFHFSEAAKDLPFSETPDEMYFYACSYLLGSRIRVFKVDPNGNLYVYFSTSYMMDTENFSKQIPLNLLEETINGVASYRPLFTFKTYFQGDFISTDSFDSYFTALFTDNFLKNFDGFICKEIPRIIKPTRPKKRALDLPSQLLEPFANLNLDTKSDVLSNDSFQLPPTDMLFNVSLDEEMSSNSIDNSAFAYNIMGFTAKQNLNNTVTPPLPEYFEFQKPEFTEKSHVKYLYVLNENADSKETILLTLNKLYHDLGVHKQINYLVVVGDGKTYDHLIQLKNEHKGDLEWLLPYIGDWHALKNYQLILMKIYLDSGLKELIGLFHHGVLFKVVAQAKAFDKTHNFLLQCWEAFYHFELYIFFLHFDSVHLAGCNFTFKEVSDIISDYLNLLNQKAINNSEVKMKLTMLENYIDNLNRNFVSFFQTLCKANKTWEFWHNFIHVDVLIYIKYYLALRTGDWNLRNFCLKHIAKLAQVSDARFYSRLLPQNLADMNRFPDFIIDHFRDGGFVMNVLGRNSHSQGLDEGHESCINKDVKAALNTCSNASLSKAVSYVPVRANCIRNIKDKLSSNSTLCRSFSKSLASVSMENVIAYKDFLISRSYLFMAVFSPEIEMKDNNIHHLISCKVLDKKQSETLASLCKLGYDHLKLYLQKCINGHIYALAKHKPLKLTGYFSNKQSISSVKQELKDSQSQNKMYRIQIAWASKNNVLMEDLKQYVTNTLPRSIATSDGLPYKGEKSKMLSIYKSRYPDAFLSSKVLSNLEAIIIDAMFFIYHPPLRSFSTFSEYLQHVFIRNVLCYYEHGIKTVHIVFDEQDIGVISPKDLERSRRDSDESDNPFVKNIKLDPNSILPSDWQKFLKIRANKKSLVNLACCEFLKLGSKRLHKDQKLYVGGGFSVCGKSDAVINNIIVSCPSFDSNILEGDSRVWAHAFSEVASRILILSADNDTYHIGLPLLRKHPDKSIFVALDNQFDSVIDLNKLANLMFYDHDFININDCITTVIQVLFIATGCDYVSFFKGHGKKSFFETFSKHVDFISSGKPPFPGKLNQIKDEWELGFLAFLRLIGSEYFKKCSIEFKDVCSTLSPQSLFLALHSNANTDLENHMIFIDKLRQALFKRYDEEKYIPSVDALRLHWRRSCWVAEVWQQSDQYVIDVPNLLDYGWTFADNKLSIVWDSEANIEKVKSGIKLWTEGCSCKTFCDTMRCGCRKKSLLCGPGCMCGNSCRNKSSTSQTCSSVSDTGVRNFTHTELTYFDETSVLSSSSDDENDFEDSMFALYEDESQY